MAGPCSSVAVTYALLRHSWRPMLPGMATPGPEISDTVPGLWDGQKWKMCCPKLGVGAHETWCKGILFMIAIFIMGCSVNRA